MRSSNPSRWVIQNARCDGAFVDCRIADGLIDAVAGHLNPSAAETVIDASEGELLPGLADHHLHLLPLPLRRDRSIWPERPNFPTPHRAAAGSESSEPAPSCAAAISTEYGRAGRFECSIAVARYGR